VTVYLTVVEVLAMHSDQIERYGGARDVRDLGMLESALFRPRTGYCADLIEEAAEFWESLAQNHPFIDCNKRAAFAATYTFLAVNGGRLTAEAMADFDFIGGLYGERAFEFARLAPWLRGHVRLEDPIARP
jgi:death-on-curing protein